jgi:hypothetical protein
MNNSSGALVMWILVPLFVALGLYLVWYSRRRKNMFEAFANTHQFHISQDHDAELQNILKRCFSIEEKGLVRSFDQLSSLVDGTPIWLFRAVELLDLNPLLRVIRLTFPELSLCSTYRLTITNFLSWINPCRYTRGYPDQNHIMLVSWNFRSGS